MIRSLDFVAVPSEDAARSRAFYVDTLGLRPDERAEARAELEGKGVELAGETLDTGVCQMVFVTDPGGNDLMLHHRYPPRS